MPCLWDGGVRLSAPRHNEQRSDAAQEKSISSDLATHPQKTISETGVNGLFTKTPTSSLRGLSWMVLKNFTNEVLTTIWDCVTPEARQGSV